MKLYHWNDTVSVVADVTTATPATLHKEKKRERIKK